jgi:hypothetical protein
MSAVLPANRLWGIVPGVALGAVGALVLIVITSLVIGDWSTQAQVVPRSEYPREVPINSIDDRVASWVGGARGKAVAVQLAPGVWAEHGSSLDLGTVDDYPSYAGFCADVKRYSQTHPGGYACW